MSINIEHKYYMMVDCLYLKEIFFVRNKSVNTKQNFKYAILRPLLLLSFVAPWDTIYDYLSGWEFMICFSKYLKRVKNIDKPTQWYSYKKINEKNLTD